MTIGRVRKSLITMAVLAVELFSVSTDAIASVEQDQWLDKIEQKLFSHVYLNNTEDERLIRIELMVYGQAKVGDQSSRLRELQVDAGANIPRAIAGSSPIDEATFRCISVFGTSLRNSGGLIPNVLALEVATYGVVQAGDIPDRIEILERTIYGANHLQSAENLITKVERLRTAVNAVNNVASVDGKQGEAQNALAMNSSGKHKKRHRVMKTSVTQYKMPSDEDIGIIGATPMFSF